MKLEHIFVYKNISKFDIGHCRTKVKVRNFSSFTAIQTVRSHNSTLVQASKLILGLSMYVQLILIYNIFEYRHA